MRNYHNYLVVLDLDGTLLTSKNTISDKTRDIIIHLTSLGVKFILASGRPLRAIKPYYDLLNLNTPIIALNGAFITDPKDSSFKDEIRKLDHNFVSDFLNEFDESNFSNIAIENGTDIYFLTHDIIYENYFHASDVKVHYGNLKEACKSDVDSLIVYLKRLKNPSVYRDFVRKYNDLDMRQWSDAPRVMEVFYKSTNKFTSILKTAEKLHIKRENIIAFGDAMNDINMIRGAGVSFAMKNGDPELQKNATFITPYDNDNDGIYYSLKKFFEL